MKARMAALVTAGVVLAASLPVAADSVPNGTYSVAAQDAPIVNVVVNGSAVQSNVPAMILGGRTLLPVRAVAEALGATVTWNQGTYTAALTAPEGVLTDAAYHSLAGTVSAKVGTDMETLQQLFQAVGSATNVSVQDAQADGSKAQIACADVAAQEQRLMLAAPPADVASDYEHLLRGVVWMDAYCRLSADLFASAAALDQTQVTQDVNGIVALSPLILGEITTMSNAPAAQ